MSARDLNNQYIRTNPWVSKLLKRETPEAILKSIEKRFINKLAGPWYDEYYGEIASDIFVDFCAQIPGFKEKFEPAVGLLLHQIILEEKQFEPRIINLIFYTIADCDLCNCQNLVYKWIYKNYKIVISDSLDVLRPTFRNALFTLAKIQKKNESFEIFWYNLWKEADFYWKPVSFLGLRIQNSKVATQEVPNLILFNHEYSAFMLCGMWSDKNCRRQLELFLKKGLQTEQYWAKQSVNLMVGKLKESNKDELLKNLELK